ncbi:flagellar basal-body MS-ring/collar protein FliF [Buchnera aphidicola]|uniref:flagellar basal-body MS-ring/collar protein FliF n=1 Tax=Buchnera aphidicola TaxID=9 RepID=UPI0034640B92
MNFGNLENSVLKNKKKIITFFSRFFTNFRILFIVVSALVITVFSFFIWFRSSNNTVLYDHLSYEDKVKVINQLQKMHIPYNFSDSSGELLVPKNKINELRSYFSDNHAVKNEDIGFELFDKEKFGISQFHEKINYQRALEGELSRTIKKINIINSARIHIALPESSLFLKDKRSSSVAIILNVKSGQSLHARQVSAILNFISRSIPDLSIKDITIVDQFGNLLNSSSFDNEPAGDTNIKYTESIENLYINRIKNILEPLLGKGNVHAEVTAQINFNSEERTQEQYSPNGKKNDQSMRSRQIIIHDTKENVHTDTTKSMNAVSDGVNSKNNLINAADHNIKNNKLVFKKMKDMRNIPVSSTSHINHENITNYELNHIISHTKIHTGEIKRLSAAVIVNYVKNKNGQFVCLKQEQLRNIDQLVHEAIGYSKSRGDSVYVMSSFFVKNDNDMPLPVILHHTASVPLFNVFFCILIFLLIIFFIILIIRKYIFLSLQKMRKDIQDTKDLIENKKKKSSILEKKIDKNLNADQLISNICNISNKNPRTIALIIRKWMNNKI